MNPGNTNDASRLWSIMLAGNGGGRQLALRLPAIPLQLLKNVCSHTLTAVGPVGWLPSWRFAFRNVYDPVRSLAPRVLSRKTLRCDHGLPFPVAESTPNSHAEQTGHIAGGAGSSRSSHSRVCIFGSLGLCQSY